MFPIPEVEYTEIGNRYLEFMQELGCLEHSDFEAVLFAVMDEQKSEGVIRTDRALPKEDTQRLKVLAMNEADRYWIIKLVEYKRKIGVGSDGVIPLNTIQSAWFDYVRGYSDVKPEHEPKRKEPAMANVNADLAVPF